MSDSSQRQDFDVLVLAPTYPPAFRAGGPARTLEALVEVAPAKFNSWVIAPNRDLGSKVDLDVQVNSWNSIGNISTKYIREHKLFQAFRQISSTKNLRPQLVYVNSFSHPVFALMPYVLFASGTWPNALLVVAPRGEMDPNALNVKGAAKKIIIWLLKTTGFAKKMIWQASNEREAVHIKNVWGPHTSIIIREDETSLPFSADSPKAHDATLRFGFVSRIVPNKGVLEAIQAVLTLEVPVQLDIYGPEEDATYVEKCRALASTATSKCIISFNGPINHSQVRTTLASFDAFVFPTYFENFSHAIAESLSVSTPVISPDTTPWTNVLAHGGGRVIGSKPGATLPDILKEISEMNPQELLAFRTSSGSAYNSWRQKTAEKHIFELALNS
jgi:glycosyltransferase involved in cell wall biosynthesis